MSTIATSPAQPTGQPQHDPTVRMFRTLLVAHVLVWTLVPTFTKPNPTIDLVEQVFWGHEWQLGYTKHPPLPSWICGAAATLTDRAVWVQYLLPQLGVAIAFWAVWRLAREILPPRRALPAVALLECCLFYTAKCEALNNNYALYPSWSLAVLFLYHALRSDRIGPWIGCGVCLGLGMLTKYSTLILAATILGFGLLHPEARKSWRRPGPYLAVAAAVLVFLPHVVWVASHGFGAVAYAADTVRGTAPPSGHVLNPLQFALFQLGMLAPLLLVATALTGWRWRLRKVEPGERMARAMLAAVALGPFAIHLAVACLLNSRLRGDYGSQLWMFTGVLMLFALELRDTPAAWRRTRWAWSAWVVISIVGTMLHPLVTPYVLSGPGRLHYPGKLLAQQVNEIWNRRYDRPLPIVAGDYFLAGNVALFSPHWPRVYESWHGEKADIDIARCPWLSDDEFRRQGGVILWNYDDRNGIRPEAVKRLGVVETVDLPPMAYLTRRAIPPLRIGVAIVPPADRR